MPTKRSGRRQPPRSAMPTYAGWKEAAAVELDRQHGVRAGVIPERLWRRLYIENMPPQEAAKQAAASP
jgi:hypothetical protein